MRSKINVDVDGRFFKNRALAAAGARFFRIWGSKLGAKIDQKSIEKWNLRWNASWHRFLNDFVGFGVPSWDAKSIKNRSKIAPKKRCKTQSRLGRVLGRLRAVKGAATYSDPVRRDPARPSALEILSRRPPGPPPFRAKILKLKRKQFLRVLTRRRPEARRIMVMFRLTNGENIKL